MTKKSQALWQDAPILRFRANGVPFSGEQLAILHYPYASNCISCSAVENTKEVDQLGVRLSLFEVEESQNGKKSNNGQCRAWGIEKNRRNASKWYRTAPPKDPKTPCYEDENSDYGRDVAFGHWCATNRGTSGAPVLSLSDDTIASVIGVHVNGYNRNAKKVITHPNRAIRSTVIAACIDVEVLAGASKVVPAGRAKKSEACQCVSRDRC